MPLNYQFYNNTLQDVRDEINRRTNLYWPERSANDSSLAWNYQKTAYIILKSLKIGSSDINQNAPVPKIKTPTAPILELYGPNYINSTGTLQGAILNSAEITSEGTYASILRITVNFTVFDRNELDNYMNSFLRPGVDIGLEYGWTVDEFQGNKGKDFPVYVNKGNIKGTVFNFSFSAKEDGTWECTLHAYGPSMMTYGFNTDAKDASNIQPDPSNYATYGLLDIFRLAKDNMASLYDKGLDVGGGIDCKKVYASQIAAMSLSPIGPRFLTEIEKRSGPIFYIYDLPSEFDPEKREQGNISYGERSGDRVTDAKIKDTSKQIYITLGNLLDLINQKINEVSKRPLPLYSTINSDGLNVCVGTNLNALFLKTGPADFTKFAFTTQRNGAPRGEGSPQSVLSLKGTAETFATQLAPNKFNNIPLEHLILINVQFIIDELNKIISGDKNVQNKKILSFLKLLFSQLETETGGILDLVLMPERNVDGDIIKVLIQNKNGVPDAALDNINVFTIPMMTKHSVVRSMSIESKVPDAVVTEVAVYSRNGVSYGENDEAEMAEFNKTKFDLLRNLKNLNDNYLNTLAGDESDRITTGNRWATDVRNIYRRLSSIQQSITLNYSGRTQSLNNILDLKTAVFPIYLKLTLDGINGFLYGNAITTNWLPKQYRDSRVYWTVTKIRHVIQNNDWTTELEAIYRVKEK